MQLDGTVYPTSPTPSPPGPSPSAPTPSPPPPSPSGAHGKYLVFEDWGGRSESEPTDAAQEAGAAGMAKDAGQLGGIGAVISVMLMKAESRATPTPSDSRSPLRMSTIKKSRSALGMWLRATTITMVTLQRK